LSFGFGHPLPAIDAFLKWLTLIAYLASEYDNRNRTALYWLTHCAYATAAIESDPSIPELQAAIEAVLRETKTPGAAMPLFRATRVQWVAGIGKADFAANKP